MTSDSPIGAADTRNTGVVVFRELSENWVLDEGWASDLASEIRRRLPSVTVEVATTIEEMQAAVADNEIVVTLEFTEEILDNIDSLRWTQALTAGVDGYDLKQLQEKNVLLTSASGVHAEPIAQHVFGFLLAFERGIKRGMEQQRTRDWETFGCEELTHKTLGIVGLGNVGRRVANIGATFGMRITGVKRDLTSVPDSTDRVVGPDDLDDILETADYVVLTCPLTEETRCLIDDERLESMRDTAILINVARGPVVDQSALVDALRRERIRGAGLDVFEEEPLPADSPLWGLPNVIITPHTAGSGPYYWRRCAEVFSENYRHYVLGETGSMKNRKV